MKHKPQSSLYQVTLKVTQNTNQDVTRAVGRPEANLTAALTLAQEAEVIQGPGPDLTIGTRADPPRTADQTQTPQREVAGTRRH